MTVERQVSGTVFGLVAEAGARLGPASLLVLGLLAGCAAVPRLGPQPAPLDATAVAASRSLAAAPAPATPAPSTPAPTTPAPTTATADWPADGWWRAYGDPQLDSLITEGLAGSPDVAAAVARLDRAAALTRQAGAAGLPRVDAQAGVQEEKQSLNMGFPDAFKPILPQGWNDGGQIAGSLGFDLDLWGRNRAALAATTSEQRAAALDVQQARLLLAVAIASAYIDLDRLFAERDVRLRLLDDAGKVRTLVEQRSAKGLENSSGPAQASAAEAAARIGASQAEQALALRRHQLAALVGAGPDRGLALTRPALGTVTIRDIPVDATTALVARRPDVIAARERVSARASQIRAARADFFPAISLSALFGTQSLGLEKLFAADSTYGRVGPAISLPIFHGGELAGRYRAARADFDAAVASYNGTVLAAYQQTADAVAAARLAGQRVDDARAQVTASEQALSLVAQRYNAGLVTLLDVLEVEDRLLSARLSRAAVEADARGADLALVRALGGGLATPAQTTSLSPIKDTSHG